MNTIIEYHYRDGDPKTMRTNMPNLAIQETLLFWKLKKAGHVKEPDPVIRIEIYEEE